MSRFLPTALAALALLAPTPAAASPVSWGPCPFGTDALRCTTISVPLDYGDPDGRRISIAVSRLSSAKPAQRRGVLLVNPGGPGLPGLALPFVLAKVLGLPQQVLDTYDVIGFDPRGVGRSTPVTCDLTPAQKAEGVNPPYPHSSADVAKQSDSARAVAKQCTTSQSASTLPHITTANTARDMDSIRAALGEPKLSYYGVSYGTYLGAVYTTLFPDRSDRIVLDSSLGPGGYDLTALRNLALGFETRFPDFAKYLGVTPVEATAKYHELAARLDKDPLPGMDGTRFRTTTFGSLYDEHALPELAKTWQAVEASQPFPPIPAAPTDNFPASYFHVICGDSQWPRSVSTYQRNVLIDRIAHPMYGAFVANIRPCAYWPSPTEPKVRITDHGPSTVLMVQNLRDPGTPLPGALRTRTALGDRARMVTIDQGGHQAYLLGANKCGNDAVTDYLVTGKRPSHDTFCPA